MAILMRSHIENKDKLPQSYSPDRSKYITTHQDHSKQSRANYVALK